MPATAKLLLPPRALASFIAATIYRDTRSATLSDIERLNYFPASPLLTVTIVLDGQLHMARGICDVNDLRQVEPAPRISVALPSDEPTVSWSPGKVAALTIAIYPDAWTQITGQPDTIQIPLFLTDALAKIDMGVGIETSTEVLYRDITPVWEKARAKGPFAGWAGSDQIADWARHLVVTGTLSQGARSTRSLERMLRLWTGRSRRSLEFYAKLENLHRVRQRAPDAELAHTALDADFSDQSHMGRSLKRATGFSPATLNKSIETEEGFWCYRLLGERF